MLDQLGRKAALAVIPSLDVTCAASRRAARLAYLHLIGRKNPLSSMCSRQ
ncbi:hypothetical protein [Desertibaculum subflavum]